MTIVTRLAVGLYALALRLYPRAFRHTFGAEMADAFRRAVADAAGRGALPLLGLLLREGMGVCAGALAERARAAHQSRMSGRGAALAGRLALLALGVLALFAADLLMPLVVFYLVVPLALLALVRAAHGAPRLERRLGWAMLVVSWPLLVFQIALVVEGWQLRPRSAALAGPLAALAQAYDGLLHLGLRRLDYGLVVTALSALICVARLRRARAAHAPWVLAMSSLAANWASIASMIGIPRLLPIDTTLPQDALVAQVQQRELLHLTLALVALVALLLVQALAPLGSRTDRADGNPGAPAEARAVLP